MSILVDEKTKKEREERAKSLISQKSFSDSINTINYAKMKNINLNPQSDDEKNFISKVDRANYLISSINPREDVPEPTLTDEEKVQSEENIKPFLDLIDKNNDEEKINKSNSDVVTNTMNNQEIDNNFSKKIAVQPSAERIMKQSEERHQNELKEEENMPLIEQKINNNSNIKVDQNVSSNINVIKNDTNNMAKNGEISIASKDDTSNLKTYTDYKLQQQKKAKDNSSIFEKGANWIKDVVGSIGVSIGSVISRNGENY